MAATKPDRCTGLTKRGEPCRQRGPFRQTPDGPRCVTHDPERKAELAQMSKRGGAAQRRRKLRAEDIPPAPQTMEDATAYLSWLADALIHKRIDAGRAKAMERIIRSFTDARKKADYERRIKELEALAKKYAKRGDR